MPLEATLTRRRTTHLQQLFWLRNAALGIQGGAVLIATYGVNIDLPVPPLLGVLAAMIVVNVATGIRLRSGRVVSESELLMQILIDVVALSAILYYAGGSTNPFTVFYLLPLTLAAIMLPRRLVWIVIVLAALCYSALLFVHVPLNVVQQSHDLVMSMHVIGMWLTFLLSAGLITYFVSRMRDREILLAETRETMLRDERILAIGTLAAGAAHELGTPLTTIGILAKELQDQYHDHKILVEDLDVLRRQVEACKGTITNMLAAARQSRFDSATALPVTEFVQSIARKWRLVRPVVYFDCRVIGHGAAPAIVVDETLGQTLTNLLNNAADASSSHVEVETGWTDRHVTIDVLDRGPGFADEALQSVGQAFFSTKGAETGRGLGLFLAKAAVERVGGSLTFQRREGGGSVARLALPVARDRS